MPPRFRWKTPSLIPSLAGAAVLLWSYAVAASPSPVGRISGGEAGTGLRGSVLLDARTATYIPPALNPGFFDWAGQKLAIRTRVHDVKFMVGIRRSDEQDGVSAKRPNRTCSPAVRHSRALERSSRARPVTDGQAP